MKTHLVRVRPGMWGGEVRSSLCNRLNAQSQDGMNVTDRRKEVTCKFCLKQMAADDERAQWKARRAAKQVRA